MGQKMLKTTALAGEYIIQNAGYFPEKRTEIF